MYTLTDNSCTTHGVLTEPSHREGKGREGNRKGGEERGETSIHSSGSLTREPAAPSAAESQTSWMVGTSTIEGIDLDAEIPCATARCEERGPRLADYILGFTAAWKEIDDDALDGTWPCCHDCWQFGTSRAAELDLPTPFDIVEVLR